MEVIINDFMKNVIQEIEKLTEQLLVGEVELGTFTTTIKGKTDELGRNIVKKTLETMDETLVKSHKRKKNWYIERKGDEKKMITVLGEISYKRTYFVSKKEKKYKYLTDEMFGIKVHDRMDQVIKSKLVELSTDLSYRKSGKEILVPVSGQTVMNKIRELNQIKYEVLEDSKKQIDILYVEADEDHIHLQSGRGAMPRLAYVHEGIKQQGKRTELINPYYVGGLRGKPNEFWEEVYEYIKNNYDVGSIKRIYLSGDGAAWIKSGLDYLPKSKFVLDKYHMNKYVLKATTHAKSFRARIWWSLNTAHKEAFIKYMNKVKGFAETEAKIKEIEECEAYMLNHWDGIEIKAIEDACVLGCSAESHVSHILSARMSSRPLGWCYEGADQMSKLRVYKANKGNIIDLFKEHKQEEKRVPIAKAIIKSGTNKLKSQYLEGLNNIFVFNQGKKNLVFEAVRNLKYYKSIEA